MKRILSMFLAAVMVMALVPMAVFAETPSALEINGLEGQDVLVGRAVEFTVTSIAAPEDEGKTVICHYEIDAEESDIEKLEYYEEDPAYDEGWHEFPSKLSGSFGPAVGFPYTNNATSTLRVTFAKAGTYSVTLSADLADGTGTICTKTFDVEVLDYADYTILNATIATAQDCVDNEAKYTTATIADVKTALEAAKAVVDANYTEKDQSVVDNANDELVAVIDALLLLADTSDIEALIATATTKVEADYTTTTWAPFKAALDAANELLENELSENDQTDVDEAKTALEDAMDALLLLAETSDIEALIATATTEIETNYTKATWAPFKAALDAANELLENELSENDQTDVDDAKAALEEAMNALKKVADTAALKAKVGEADALDENIYSTVTFGAMIEKLDAAKALLDEDLSYVDDQTRVATALDELTTAVANLKKLVAVSVSATAVASDVTAEYGKADTIVLVFGVALDCSEADVIDVLSIATDVASAEWVDTYKTVLKLTLIDNYSLTNGTVIAFEESEAVVDTNGNVVSETAVTVIGNLEKVYEEVTATAMTATIVNVDDKPYMVNGDKIVLVFNAPVYGNPATITVSGMEFAVVANTDNTVYERVLVATADSVLSGQELAYGDIKATLKGTFGGTVVPEVVRALVEDVDGTAKTAGDKINVFFNAPTNKVAGTVENTFVDFLVGATGEWFDNQTLVITLGETPIIITDKIDLSNLGIKDFYGTEDADADDIELEGSFGVAVQPTLLTLTAISKYGAGAPSAGDEIHLAFNVKMKEDAIDISDFTFQYGDYGSATAEVTPNARWADYDDYSVIIITLGKEATVVPGTTKITVTKELYEESGNKICANVANRTINGTFGTSIAPTLINATIVKRVNEVGSQPGDQIVLLFNVPTNHADIINLISVPNGSLGNYVEEGDWTNNNTIYTITLGNGASIENGSKITFTNTNGELKDINGQKSAATKTIDLIGSFGTEAEEVGISPTSVTATIVKTTTVAGVQEEDQIVFAFNVATNGVDLVPYFKDFDIFGDEPKGVWSNGNTIYTLILGNGATVTDGTKISFTEEAGIKDVNGINGAVKLNNISLVGSFGKEVKPVTVAPTLLDAVIIKGSNTVGATKGDKIQFIFNMAINDADLYKELGGVNVFGAESNGAKDNNIYTITIGNNANIPASFNITAAAGLKDAAEFSEAALIPNIILTGSFGDEIKPVTAAPTLFKAVIVKATDTVGPQAGDKIQLVFNMAINGADLFAALGGEAVFGAGSYGSADSNVYTITLGTGITSIPTTFSINSDAGLKDASGYSANAVIPNFTLVGSFGIVVNPVATKPALKNAVIVKDSGKLGINAGDKIVLIFNVATNGKDDNINLLNNIAFPGRNNETLGNNPSGKWISDIEYEITLGEGASISESVSENAIIKFNHHDRLMDKAKITAAGEIEIYKFEGTFGESIAPVAISAVAFSDDGVDYIEVLFNVAVERLDDGVMIFENNNNFLGTEPYGEWMADNLYRITLDDNYTIKNTNLLHFNDAYTIYAKNGNAAMAAGSTIAVTGELRKPMVTEVYAGTKVVNGDDVTYEAAETITIVFSSKTNGGEIDLSAQSSSLGIGATATWNDAKTELTIALGTDRKISAGSGYILLNGLGITNGFDNNEVVGQYSISAGILPEDELETDLIRVNAREDNNYMTVIFNAPTNMYGKTLATEFNMSDIEANIEATHTFGTGATAEWETASKLVIKLGADSTFKNEKAVAANATVTFKNLKFANGLGSIKVEAEKVTGSFDGRETALDKLTAKVEGDYTIATVTLTKQDLDFGKNVEPEGDEEVDNFDAIVTFVIWDKDGKLVTDMNSMNIDVNAVDEIELQSKFATKEAGKVDVYVTDTYIDAITEGTPAFELLADTVTSSVAAQ